MQFTRLLISSVLGFCAFTYSHPNEVHKELSSYAALRLREYKDNTHRGMAACQDKLKRDGVHVRAIARRQATVSRHSKKNLDTATILPAGHLRSDAFFNLDTPEKELFESKTACVLNVFTPNDTKYYVLGEHIRSDMREKQLGIPLIFEAQFVDVTTCKPITKLWADVSNCNSTGVYSGHATAKDPSNLNTTFLRGVQETDSDGVVQFVSIFPGHYSPRTNHIHMVTHLNATVQPNKTITGGRTAYIGELLWDQDLIYKVQATYPYNTNTANITTNVNDIVFKHETSNTTSNPVFEYVYLGEHLSDGIFAWTTIAVNVSATYELNYDYALTANGGVVESDYY